MLLEKDLTRVIAVSALAAIVVQTSCRKDVDEPSPTDFGFDFTPYEVGATWTYRVDSINYNSFDQNGSIDTFSFYVRKTVTDTIVDSDQRKTFIVSESRTDTLNDNFIQDRVYQASINDYRFEVVDSNVKVVLLTYPPRLFDFWDANVFNIRMKEEYEVIDIVASDSVENMSFGETIHVLQRDEDFRTVRNYGLEKYSRGVGLIYSRQIAWVKKTLNDPDEVQNGFDYRYQLISFSKCFEQRS